MWKQGSRTMKGLRFLPYLKTNKIACLSFLVLAWDIWLRFQNQNTLPHSMAGTMSFIFTVVPLPQVLQWWCSGRIQVGTGHMVGLCHSWETLHFYMQANLLNFCPRGRHCLSFKAVRCTHILEKTVWGKICSVLTRCAEMWVIEDCILRGDCRHRHTSFLKTSMCVA